MNKYIYLCLSILKKEGVKYGNTRMKKTESLEIIKTLLKTDADLAFLLNLSESDLETLVVCIRERVD